jgi:hypothetical protein
MAQRSSLLSRSHLQTLRWALLVHPIYVHGLSHDVNHWVVMALSVAIPLMNLRRKKLQRGHGVRPAC